MNKRDAAIEHTIERMATARRILAYGGFDGVARRPLYHEDGTFPQFAAAAQGCELVDSTGERYVDWINGWGPVLLGYRHPAVEDAIRAQLACGPTLSLMHEIEIEVAELLTQMFPCAEMVAFGKNGSDMLTAAVRVARAVTGRRILLQYGMHGFHDWYICSLPQFRGLPEELRALIHGFEYGDLAALERLFARFDGQVAAIVMEPVREILPPPGYLEGVRELCTRHGTLLIWDEVVTALRVARGGAQELFGVVPDLACLGKAMGNGMPLAALVGKRVYMQHLPSVGVGMTFRGETLSLAAARAVLRFVREHDVPAQLARVGESVRAGVAALSAARGVHVQLCGPPARMTFVFQDTSRLGADTQRALLVQECLKRGLLTNGNLLASYAHDEAAIERTLRSIDGAFEVLARAQTDGRAQLASCARGFVERVEHDGDELVLSGWMLLDDGAADAIVARAPSGTERVADTLERPDVAQAYASVPGAARSGFALRLSPREFAGGQRFDFVLCARRAGRDAFRCRILRTPGTALPAGAPYACDDGVLLL